MNEESMSSTATDSIVTPWAILQLAQYNSYLEEEDLQDVVRYPASDLQRAATLGSGAFCDVSLVVSRSNKKRLAMKQLNLMKIQSTHQFLTAASDLLTDAHFLSKLDHPNIINLRGISADAVSDSFEGDKSGFFFTMDVMEETLRDRIQRWRNDKAFIKKSKGFRKVLHRKHKNSYLLSMYGRLETGALGVAKAMKYLHQQGILHRDLKPSNIGFNAETGEVCLFDFGLASKLTNCCKNEVCGTPRYMAPEVMRGEGYSYKSDVYSFGVVLYEIVSEREWMPRRSSTGMVRNFSFRPNLKKIPCQKIAYLIGDCLSDDPSLRPSFQEIIIVMSDVLWPEIEKKPLKTLDRSESVTSVAKTFEPSDVFGMSYQDMGSLM